jgi:hypothetical protein
MKSPLRQLQSNNKSTYSELPRSAGILDDFAVRKNVDTVTLQADVITPHGTKLIINSDLDLYYHSLSCAAVTAFAGGFEYGSISNLFVQHSASTSAGKFWGIGDGGYLTKNILELIDYQSDKTLALIGGDNQHNNGFFALIGDSAFTQIAEFDIGDRQLVGDIRAFTQTLWKVNGEYNMYYLIRDGESFYYGMSVRPHNTYIPNLKIGEDVAPNAALHVKGYQQGNGTMSWNDETQTPCYDNGENANQFSNYSLTFGFSPAQNIYCTAGSNILYFYSDSGRTIQLGHATCDEGTGTYNVADDQDGSGVWGTIYYTDNDGMVSENFVLNYQGTIFKLDDNDGNEKLRVEGDGSIYVGGTLAKTEDVWLGSRVLQFKNGLYVGYYDD